MLNIPRAQDSLTTRKHWSRNGRGTETLPSPHAGIPERGGSGIGPEALSLQTSRGVESKQPRFRARKKAQHRDRGPPALAHGLAHSETLARVSGGPWCMD